MTSNHFFEAQMKKKKTKKSSEKEIYSVKKCDTNIRNNAEKINVSLIIFTQLLLYNVKFV